MRRRLALAASLTAIAALGACDSGGRVHPHAARSTGGSSAASSTAAGLVEDTRPPLPYQREADKPGSSWRIPKQYQGGIEGFADRTSVRPGQPLRLYVSTATPTFRVLVFRMGWYQGDLGRLVWTSPAYPGRKQSRPVLVGAPTRTMAARWQPSVTLRTADWMPGDYLLRLDAIDTHGHRHESFVPLAVRTPSADGRVVIVNAVTTWQAYNTWGGSDLYVGPNGSFATRSRAVSFDRPYLHDQGAGYFVSRELPVIAEAEQLGLEVDYVTDVDLELDPTLLRGARAVFSLGHDEYWSPRMRAALTRARDAGTNLAFLGANAMFRRIRLAATPLGPGRLEINYKVASEDPLFGRDDAAVTADWPSAPAANPESRLLGAQYGCFPNGKRKPGVVVDPQNWLLAGVEVSKGEQLPGLIGPELDSVQLSYPTPRPIEVILHSPANCPGGVPSHADATYYVAHSGAGVFDAGTIDWVCALGDSCGARVHGPTAPVVRAITDNLLMAFARGPAGREHPAHDNLAALGITK